MMRATFTVTLVGLATALALFVTGCDFDTVGRKPADAQSDQSAGEEIVSPDGTSGEDLVAEIVQTCGNGICEKHEDPCSCPVDCKSAENCCADDDCPQPQCGPCCHAVCVDFQCEDQWDSPCCWNGDCEEGESFDTCPEDCPPEPQCGDGVCQPGEDPCACPQDCLEPGACCEDHDCPQPLCGPCCTAVCDGGWCVDVWEQNCCWNGDCEPGETPENCPEDCPPLPGCGDGICQADEDGCTCPQDCGEVPECCTDDDCPPFDCGPCCLSVCVAGMCEALWLDECCWNGKCEEGEDYLNCPEDCPPPDSTECEEQGGFCVGWTPGYTNCPEGTVPSGWACTTKNEVCCIPEEMPVECDFSACSADDDCVKTQAGCCPCSMGGVSIAVAAQCLDAWIDQLACPPDVMCPAVYLCDDSVPACVNGLCTLVGGIVPDEP